MITGIEKREAIENLPAPHTLFINEVAVQVGCTGCRSECAGIYVVQTENREDRDALTEDLEVAVGCYDVPVTVRTSASTKTLGEMVVNPDLCAEAPCQNLVAIETFESILSAPVTV